MNFDREWTQFAVDAEIEYTGSSARLAKAHNDLRADFERLLFVLKFTEHLHSNDLLRSTWACELVDDAQDREVIGSYLRRKLGPALSERLRELKITVKHKPRVTCAFDGE